MLRSGLDMTHSRRRVKLFKRFDGDTTSLKSNKSILLPKVSGLINNCTFNFKKIILRMNVPFLKGGGLTFM